MAPPPLSLHTLHREDATVLIWTAVDATKRREQQVDGLLLLCAATVAILPAIWQFSDSGWVALATSAVLAVAMFAAMAFVTSQRAPVLTELVVGLHGLTFRERAGTVRADRIRTPVLLPARGPETRLDHGAIRGFHVDGQVLCIDLEDGNHQRLVVPAAQIPAVHDVVHGLWSRARASMNPDATADAKARGQLQKTVDHA